MNRFSLQQDTPLVGGKLSGNEIEQGGFPRSIRTDEPGNLALFDAAVHLMQCQQPAEAFGYVTDFKQLHRLSKHPHRWLEHLSVTAVPPPVTPHFPSVTGLVPLSVRFLPEAWRVPHAPVQLGYRQWPR